LDESRRTTTTSTPFTYMHKMRQPGSLDSLVGPDLGDACGSYKYECSTLGNWSVQMAGGKSHPAETGAHGGYKIRLLDISARRREWWEHDDTAVHREWDGNGNRKPASVRQPPIGPPD
jgi:hypothetical protein